MDFGTRLKGLRKGQHLTQQQLATRLGVQKSVVSYYESGDRFPSYDVLIKIARIFHKTTDSLLGIDPPKKIVDVSKLSDSEIEAVQTIVDALSNNHNK